MNNKYAKHCYFNTGMVLSVPVNNVSYRFRVRLDGNHSEVQIFTMDLGPAKRLLKLSSDQFEKRIKTLTKEDRLLRRGEEKLLTFRTWNNGVPHLHTSGLALDADLSVTVEDDNGGMITDFTAAFKGQSPRSFSNDNEQLVICPADHIDGLVCEGEETDDDVEVGLIQAVSNSYGTYEATFHSEKPFDPKLLNISIDQIGSKNLTGEIRYDGEKPFDLELGRIQKSPPTASIKIAKL